MWSAPNDGTPEKLQNAEWYENALGKGLWSGKDNEISQKDWDVWGSINFIDNQQDQNYISTVNDLTLGKLTNK